MIYLGQTIKSSFHGFSELIRVSEEISSCNDEKCEMNFSKVDWFDANMCAPFGAILYKFYVKGWPITVYGQRPEIASILQRNRFLPNFGFDIPIKPDYYGTTIEYKRFERTDSASFIEYITEQFAGKKIPKMTEALKKRFRASISELFENAVAHSQTTLGIFACGQYYPKGNRLDFSVADRGMGIRRAVNRFTGQRMNAVEAIEWATTGDNTTRERKGGKPGGLGLKLIKEFIDLNKGRVHIVSDSGYWCYEEGQTKTRRFKMPFPGTVVNIEINTADTSSYRLASELNPDSIF